MKKLILSIVIIIGASNLVLAGGPWPQLKGKGYFKLSEWWTIFDQHYTDTGLIDPNTTSGVFNTFLYGEYGLSDNLTVVANVPIFSRSTINNLRSRTSNEVLVEGDAINSIGDIDLGVKYGFNKESFPIAISATFGIPSGIASGGKENNLQTGDGEFNQMIQLDAGKSFKLGQTKLYATAFVGFNNRTQGFSEEFRYGAELGANLVEDKIWLVSKLNASESFKNGFTAETTTSTSIFANNSEFTSLGLELNVNLGKNFGFSAGFASAIRGEIIAAAASYNVGVYYQIK